MKQAMTSNSTLPANDAQILPSEKTQAVQHLIKLTDSLITLSEREAQGLAQNDMVSFAILQDEKASLAEHYARASAEFRDRLHEFRGMSSALLDRLEQKQNRLGAISAENNAIVTRLYARAEENAKTGLKTARDHQEKTKVNFDTAYSKEESNA